MPVSINLIPRLELEKEKLGQRRFAFVVLSVFVLVAVSLGLFLFYFYVGGKEAELKEVKARVEQEEKAVHEKKDLEAVVRKIELKSKVAGELLGSLPSFSTLLKSIASSTPPDVSILDVAVKGGEVTLEGRAAKFVALSRYLTSLLQKDLGGEVFEKAELKSVAVEKEGAGPRFVLNLTLKKQVLFVP